MTVNENENSRAVTAQAYSPTESTDPHRDYEQLRQQCPVVHSDDFGGFWSLMTFADASKASRDFKTFASGQPFVEYPSPNCPIPISTNPPVHGFYRKFLNQYFVEDRVQALLPSIERIVAEQLAPLLAKGGGDIYRTVARLVPPQVLAELLGLSATGWIELTASLDEADGLRHDITAFGSRQATLWDDAVTELIDDRRASPRDPAHDIVTGILALEPDGQPISDADARSIVTQLFAAGADTTSSAMGSLVNYLATNLVTQQQIRRNMTLLPAAIEEVLRMGPPLHQTVRRTTRETEVHGVRIPEGELVAINVASANRDNNKFDDPHHVRLDRERNPHLTFGFGPHMCIGAPIARQELRIFGEQLLAGTRSITLAHPVESSGRALRTGWASMDVTLET
ncbi:cytochrome P450 [Rhodococcoides fascians]|uniref:cytochrome P450 n=1 Tax=Rhodococcoides fascians TaxID=1828 RepID=UPI00050C7FD1|nr:cytochrome P450 [Rhodococcus fascians]